jgi:selenocysteine lyase/cysteine desulfurase
MSQSVRAFEKSFLADNAVTAYNVVKVTSTGCDVATASSDAIIGVAQATCAAAEQAVVRFIGTTKVIASAAISAGAKLTATTAGKVVTTTTDHHNVIGIALEAAAADGDIIEALLVNYTLSA